MTFDRDINIIYSSFMLMIYSSYIYEYGHIIVHIFTLIVIIYRSYLLMKLYAMFVIIWLLSSYYVFIYEYVVYSILVHIC